jgi:hypothetical protein
VEVLQAVHNLTLVEEVFSTQVVVVVVQAAVVHQHIVHTTVAMAA